MFINEKKTQIKRLTHGFTFLKMHYKVKGKHISVTADNSLFIRKRRRLKKLKKKCDGNAIPFKTILNCYKSWRGTVQRYANKPLNLQYTDDLFVDLFYKHLNQEVA